MAGDFAAEPLEVGPLEVEPLEVGPAELAVLAGTETTAAHLGHLVRFPAAVSGTCISAWHWGQRIRRGIAATEASGGRNGGGRGAG